VWASCTLWPSAPAVTHVLDEWSVEQKELELFRASFGVEGRTPYRALARKGTSQLAAELEQDPSFCHRKGGPRWGNRISYYRLHILHAGPPYPFAGHPVEDSCQATNHDSWNQRLCPTNAVDTSSTLASGGSWAGQLRGTYKGAIQSACSHVAYWWLHPSARARVPRETGATGWRHLQVTGRGCP
jgi:hypothetical protein